MIADVEFDSLQDSLKDKATSDTVRIPCKRENKTRNLYLFHK